MSVFCALLHAAGDDVRARGATSAEAFDRLQVTLGAVLATPSRAGGRRAASR